MLRLTQNESCDEQADTENDHGPLLMMEKVDRQKAREEHRTGKSLSTHRSSLPTLLVRSKPLFPEAAFPKAERGQQAPYAGTCQSSHFPVRSCVGQKKANQSVSTQKPSVQNRQIIALVTRQAYSGDAPRKAHAVSSFDALKGAARLAVRRTKSELPSLGLAPFVLALSPAPFSTSNPARVLSPRGTCSSLKCRNITDRPNHGSHHRSCSTESPERLNHSGQSADLRIGHIPSALRLSVNVFKVSVAIKLRYDSEHN